MISQNYYGEELTADWAASLPRSDQTLAVGGVPSASLLPPHALTQLCQGSVGVVAVITVPHVVPPGTR